MKYFYTKCILTNTVFKWKVIFESDANDNTRSTRLIQCDVNNPGTRYSSAQDWDELVKEYTESDEWWDEEMTDCQTYDAFVLHVTMEGHLNG